MENTRFTKENTQGLTARQLKLANKLYIQLDGANKDLRQNIVARIMRHVEIKKF